jgi:urease accessory protein
MTDAPWTVWQFVDSAFPTGGFAHSWGLEAAWQTGEVAGEEGLRHFLHDSILQAGRGALPLASSAHDSPHRLPQLDTLCDRFLTNPVANRASAVQGRAFMSTCARIWRGDRVQAIASAARPLRVHYAPVFGAVLGALDCSRGLMQQLFLFTATRGVLAAAVRLGIVGSYRAQQLQRESGRDVEYVLRQCGDLGEDDLAQSAPLIDLVQAAHDRLYSRVFQS